MSNDPKEPLLLDHNYDGIQELDNNLPRWWVWLFYITIIFAAVYLVYYHVTRTGDLSAAEYAKEMKAGELIKNAAMGKFESSIPRCSRPKTPPCWKSAARPMSNSARRAIATTAAAWLARTSRMTIGFTAVPLPTT
jgi:hypothetical protein